MNLFENHYHERLKQEFKTKFAKFHAVNVDKST